MHVLIIPGRGKLLEVSAMDYVILEPETEEERKTLVETAAKIQQAKDFRSRLPAMLKLLLPFIR